MTATKEQQLFDKKGYLVDPDAWSPELAQQIANNEALQLTPDHWQILYWLREYYQTYQLIPPMRIMVKLLAQQLGADKISSISIYQLFPEGAQQFCKIAGLPKPAWCV